MTPSVRSALRQRIEKFRGSLVLRGLLAVLVLLALGLALAHEGEEPSPALDVRINFQSPSFVPPAGYLRDYGQAFGPRSGAGQEGGYSYGWVEPGTSNPRRLDSGGTTPGNGRARSGVADPLLASFMHMQADQILRDRGAFNGAAWPGSWEFALPAGRYRVEVTCGDGAFTDSRHRIQVEGVTAIADFAPSPDTLFRTASVEVEVADGRLTLDAAGGTNTKVNAVRIASLPSRPRPAVHASLPADGDTGISPDTVISLILHLPEGSGGLDPGTLDTAAVRLVRVADGSRIPSFLSRRGPDTLLLEPTASLAEGALYRLEVTESLKDLAGAPFLPFSTGFSTRSLVPPPPAFSLHVNFQDPQTVPPDGYVRDFGQPFGARTGAYQDNGRSYGWVVPGTAVPLDLSAGGTVPGNGRNRGVGELREATFMHMQADDIAALMGRFNGTPLEGAWELALPDGPYTVTVAVGDTFIDSRHALRVEGVTAIDSFIPTPARRHHSATVQVEVRDGRLTVDAVGGTNTKITWLSVRSGMAPQLPSVRSCTPVDGAAGVSRETAVSCEVNLPNTGGGVDASSLTSSHVRLTRASDGLVIPATVNTSGGGDVIVLQPLALLEANTRFLFTVTAGVKDVSGAAFRPFSLSFTTGSAAPVSDLPVAFEKAAQPISTGSFFTSLVLREGRLHAATLTGEILSYPLAGDGSLGAPDTVLAVKDANGGPRAIIGLAFDPLAPSPALYVAHGAVVPPNGNIHAPEWSGKISRLSGPGLRQIEDVVVNLPRSIRDHMSNGLAFGPDGALYLLQGSNTAMGAPDNTWGLRPERILTAAVLRLDLDRLGTLPLDVKTEEGGVYNPLSPSAPLTLHATGIRNAYDLLWHSNGSLYVPTNGSAAGGNAPATPDTLPASCLERLDTALHGPYAGPRVPALSNIPQARHDYLFRVLPQGYYGHPNPARCEWVLNGGNPTASPDPGEVAQYPAGILPDRNWRGFAFDFGTHKSPNGVLEYRSAVFGNALKGKVLVTRYSAGDDILVLKPGAAGDIDSTESGLPGLTGFSDPLDIAENPATGDLYVTELGARRITLLRPVLGGGRPALSLSPAELLFTDPIGGAASPAQAVRLENFGNGNLILSSLSFAGTDSASFALREPPALPLTLRAGQALELAVVFLPAAAGVRTARLVITGNDPAKPQVEVSLRGLGTLGQGGSNEPSLQWILDAHRIPVNVGDPAPSDNALPTAPLLGEEVSLPRFRKADEGPVTVELLAAFGPSGVDPMARLGWYRTAAPDSLRELLTVPASASQTLSPAFSGQTSFDPGAEAFGLYSLWPFFSNRKVFSEDALNAFPGALPHHMRVYPLKGAGGAVEPNAYVVAFEEHTSGFDFQDLVFVLRNVEAVPEAPKGILALENLDGLPYADRLVFSRMGSGVSTHKVHDTALLRLRNTGAGPLRITALTVTGKFTLQNGEGAALPLSIPAGAFHDLAVRFTENAGGRGIRTGTLLIQTDAPGQNRTVELAGAYMQRPEGNNEVTAPQIAELFGYGITLAKTGEALSDLNRLVGDEVAVPKWKRANPALPVTVRQIAAFHGCCTDEPGFQITGPGGGSFKHNALYGQSILPTLSGSLTAPAGITLQPGAAVFEIRIANYSSNAVYDGMRGVRAWPLRDRQGRLVPNTWFLIQDYVLGGAAANFDFNDNIYIVTNIQPETAATDPFVPGPHPGAPALRLAFKTPVPGTAADRNGQGTGFPDALPNKDHRVNAPTSHLPALLRLDTAAGILEVTSSPGGFAGPDLTQANALRLPFDGRSSRFQAIAVLKGPLDALDSLGQEAGLWIGPDGDNQVKLTVGVFAAGGAPSLLLQREAAGAVANLGAALPLANPERLLALELVLEGDASTGLVKGFYRTVLPEGRSALLPLGTEWTWSGAQRERFFDRRSFAGLLAKHGTAPALAFAFDAFSVENADAAAGGSPLHLLDVGGTVSLTASDGRTFLPDAGTFSPATAPTENQGTPAIAGTADPALYQTYRGNVGLSTPQGQRVLSYELPLVTPGTVTVKLHFAEVFWGAPGKGPAGPRRRIFDVEVEGVKRLDDFDLTAAAGGAVTALVVPLTAVRVEDGSLSLRLSAELDFPSLAAIEVLSSSFTRLSWTPLSPAPFSTAEAQGAAVDGKLFLFGGFQSNPFGVRQGMAVYDTATRAWTEKASIPQRLTHAAVAEDGPFLYVAGGYVGNSTGGQVFASKKVHRYDTRTDSWSAAPDLPEARGSGALLRLGRKLHFFGGADLARADKGDHWSLDLDLPGAAWTPLPALPNPRSHMGFAALNGRAYALGGQHSVDQTLITQKSVHVYDPATALWSPAQDLPVGLSHISSTTMVLDGRILVLGGETAHGAAVKSVRAYDPKTDTWSSLPDLPAARMSGVAGILGGKVVFATGSNSNLVWQGTPLP